MYVNSYSVWVNYICIYIYIPLVTGMYICISILVDKDII